jgi:hypothetical protein
MVGPLFRREEQRPKLGELRDTSGLLRAERGRLEWCSVIYEYRQNQAPGFECRLDLLADPIILLVESSDPVLVLEAEPSFANKYQDGVRVRDRRAEFVRPRRAWFDRPMVEEHAAVEARVEVLLQATGDGERVLRAVADEHAVAGRRAAGRRHDGEFYRRTAPQLSWRGVRSAATMSRRRAENRHSRRESE